MNQELYNKHMQADQTNSNHNDFSNDPRLASIEKEKLKFLNNLIFEMQHLNEKEKLPFIMALLSSNKQEALQLSNEQLHTLMTVLKDYADIDQFKNMQSLLSFMR